MHRFPLPPSANKNWRFAHGRVIVSQEAANYKETVKMLARVDGATLIKGPVALTVDVYRPRKSGDLDNYLKVLLDALQGVFYRNDSQVREIHATLHEDRHEPRVEVTAEPFRAMAREEEDWANICTPDK